MPVLNHFEVIARNLEATKADVRRLVREREAIGAGIEALQDAIRQDEQLLAAAQARGEYEHPAVQT